MTANKLPVHARLGASSTHRLYGSWLGGGVLYKMFVTASSADGGRGCEAGAWGRRRTGLCILSVGQLLLTRLVLYALRAFVPRFGILTGLHAPPPPLALPPATYVRVQVTT